MEGLMTEWWSEVGRPPKWGIGGYAFHEVYNVAIHFMESADWKPKSNTPRVEDFVSPWRYFWLVWTQAGKTPSLVHHSVIAGWRLTNRVLQVLQFIFWTVEIPIPDFSLRLMEPNAQSIIQMKGDSNKFEIHKYQMHKYQTHRSTVLRNSTR